MKRTKLNHRQLAEDLADARDTPLIEVHCGSPWMQRGVPRADVVNIRPSYTRFCIDIYEVKTSRSNFLSSINSGKWKKYLPHCHRLYFALPAGIVSRDEVPVPAGLIVRGSKGWTVVKGAKNRKTDIPQMTILAFLFYRKKVLSDLKRRHYILTGYNRTRNRLKALGKRVAKAVHYWNDNHDWRDHI